MIRFERSRSPGRLAIFLFAGLASGCQPGPTQPTGAAVRPSASTAAFTAVVTGTVVDDRNEPVSGAEVLVEGATAGTRSDDRGAFSVAVAVPRETYLSARVTHAGFEPAVRHVFPWASSGWPFVFRLLPELRLSLDTPLEVVMHHDANRCGFEDEYNCRVIDVSGIARRPFIVEVRNVTTRPAGLLLGGIDYPHALRTAIEIPADGPVPSPLRMHSWSPQTVTIVARARE